MPLQRVHSDRLRQQIATRLQSVEEKLRPEVIRIRFSFGDDWSGDPAIFFRIVVADEASSRNDLAEFTGGIRARIRDNLGIDEFDLIPYFNFRTDSEQNHLKTPEWD